MNASDYTSLCKSKIFAGIAETEVRDMVSGFDESVRTYKKNETIYSAHDFTQNLCIILKGKALVYKTNAENRRITMNRLGVSDCFSMASLFYEAEVFPTQIIAACECRVCFIQKEQVIRMFASCTQVAINYAGMLTERIHFMARQIESLTCTDLGERLLSFLSAFPVNDSGEIELPFSMLELSQRLNMGRASLYRTISALTQKGLLARDGKKLKLL